MRDQNEIIINLNIYFHTIILVFHASLSATKHIIENQICISSFMFVHI